jgi:hypothetical protein
MYNETFKVKYHDIKQELLAKIVSKETEAGAEHDDLSESYSVEDVTSVCDKLYKDEIASVFNTDNILDDKIDIGMKAIINKMMENDDFNSCIKELKINLQKYNDYNFSVEDLDEDTINCIVNLTLFSEPLFHLTHKCICQNLLEGRIDNYLIDELKETIRTQ